MNKLCIIEDQKVPKEQEMERMSIKRYAGTHKLSMFNVVKMVKSGELKSEVVEENGKETTYILCDPQISSPNKRHSQEETLQEDLRIDRLEREVAILRRELDALKMSMGIRG